MFCYGEPTDTLDLDRLWDTTLKDAFRQIITYYHGIANQNGKILDIILTGQSAGAGMAYYYTNKLLKKLDNIINSENLYVILFGLGRVPTCIQKLFIKNYHTKHFKVIDIITYNNELDNPMPDQYLDNISLIYNNKFFKKYLDFPNYLMNSYTNKPPYPYGTKDKDGFRHDGAEFNNKKRSETYFNNMEKIKNSLRERLKAEPENKDTLDEVLNYLNIPTQDCEITRLCSLASSKSKMDWGRIYSREWTECQKIYDRYYNHNSINTFMITPNKMMVPINKNRFLEMNNIEHWDIIKGHEVHQIKTYSTFMPDNLDNILDLEKNNFSKNDFKPPIFDREVRTPVLARKIRPPVPNRAVRTIVPDREVRHPVHDREIRPLVPDREVRPSFPNRDVRLLVPEKHQKSTKNGKTLSREGINLLKQYENLRIR